jgi:hypothetical protein
MKAMMRGIRWVRIPKATLVPITWNPTVRTTENVSFWLLVIERAVTYDQ